MICAAWYRVAHLQQQDGPEQVLAFRVPLRVWEEAFAAAGAALDR